jgi:hypothetical protein
MPAVGGLPKGNNNANETECSCEVEDVVPTPHVGQTESAIQACGTRLEAPQSGNTEITS